LGESGTKGWNTFMGDRNVWLKILAKLKLARLMSKGFNGFPSQFRVKGFKLFDFSIKN
jgi:hypothetical protein